MRRAASLLASSRAQAPSLTPEALPAVTLPPSRNGVPERGQLLQGGVATRVLVVLDHFGRAFALGDLDRHDFRARRPLAWAAAALCWLRRAKASWSAREMPNCSATFSAVSGIESMP
jgi:hypothetical protein